MSCSSSSLIKLCVVFLLNISPWFTTGTLAPPLSQSYKKLQPTPNSMSKESAIKHTTTSEQQSTTDIDTANKFGKLNMYLLPTLMQFSCRKSFLLAVNQCMKP